MLLPHSAQCALALNVEIDLFFLQTFACFKLLNSLLHHCHHYHPHLSSSGTKATTKCPHAVFPA